MATVKQIAERIASEDGGKPAWPTRAQRERGIEETDIVAPEKTKAQKVKPTRKVGFVALAGALTTLVSWGLTQYGITLDPEAASALTALVAAAAGFAVPDNKE